jgi:acyl-CoA reductase-like NAD-dependent aldehyde dehydrogenase
MFWVPIAFACLVAGECVFVKYPSEQTEAHCARSAQRYMSDLEKSGQVKLFEITCIQVKPPEMI